MTIQRVRSLFYIFIMAILVSFLGIISSADAASQTLGITGSILPTNLHDIAKKLDKITKGMAIKDQADYYSAGGYGIKYQAPSSPSSKTPFLHLFTQSPSYPSNLFSGHYFYNLPNPTTTKQMGANPSNTYLHTKADVLTLLSSTNSNVLRRMETGVLSGSSEGIFYTPPSKTAGIDSGNESKTDLATRLSQYNSHNFIGLVQYTDTQAEFAKKFINHVANLPAPVILIDFNLLAKENKNLSNIIRNTSTAQAYISAAHNLMASYSVALDNLNFIYNERISLPTKSLGTDIRTLPYAMRQQASPMAIDNWMATRRLSGTPSTGASWKSWHDQIESAGPATINRETVYLLADMLNELHKTRILNERLLATLSVTQMQNTTPENLITLGRTLCDPSLDLFKVPGVCPNTEVRT